MPASTRAVSPGSGIIALTSTTRATGTRAHTSGATNPASDCATSTASRLAPIAPTTRVA